MLILLSFLDRFSGGLNPHTAFKHNAQHEASYTKKFDMTNPLHFHFYEVLPVSITVTEISEKR